MTGISFWLLGSLLAGSPSAPPGWKAPLETGFLPQWECREGPASDTLFTGRGNGPMHVLENGAPLRPGADYRELPGDTALALTRMPGAADTICLVRYASPAFPNPRQRLYALDAVPVLPASGSSAEAFADADSRGSAAGSAEKDTGAYKLDLSGSKSLAVSVGQGGAVGLDASLLVNVKGQIAENTYIEGSLSDQNTPVQPEGTTTTLREIDTKYLRVYGRQYEYRLGDYTLAHGYAGEDLFSIQAEGARLRYGENGAAGTVEFARSKGLFRSDTLRGVDGQQRGYYLRGRDGATFITVLAGTERLWRNGVLLRRGTDYTIDYSQGRVDFLPQVQVTGENLFSVEFQYSEETFPRIVFGGEVADTLGAFRFSLRGIEESEDAQNPAAGAPDAATLQRYRDAGDSALTDSAGAAVHLPQRLGAAVFAAEWQGGQAGSARFTALGSLFDKNLYSGRDDGDNLGFSTRYEGEHRFGSPLDKGGFTRVILEPVHEHRSRDYASFHQLIETRAFRDAWNLDASVGEKDFDANSLRLILEPYSGWQVGAGGGAAYGRMGDSARADSRRSEAFTRIDAGNTHAEASAEAKLASDPLRRDNYRQHAEAASVLSGWSPKAEVVHDEWFTALPAGPLSHSHLWQPSVALESPALGDRWIWTSGSDALYGQSNYEGVLPGVEDSLVDVGFSQKLRLLAWGPVSGDAYASRRYHRAWLPDAQGNRSVSPEKAAYDQAEANLSVADYPKGYGAQMHYQASRTAETPLVESYRKVESGRGDYAYDSLLNAYYRAESGGDYVLTGLVRDSTAGSQPYQDLQWNLRLDLSPGKWPAGARIGGFFSDVDLGLDVQTDHQDSAADPVPLPRFTDAQIEAVRSGRASYEPTLHWHAPEGGRSASLRYRREYAKGAGLYAYRERNWETEGEYRWEWTENWEASWIGEVQSQWRQGLSASASDASRIDKQSTQALLYRHLPQSLTLIPSVEYRRVEGEDAGLPVDLQGVTPQARVEKGAFYGGRASAEYGLHYLFGRGEGSYFATDGYRKGVTHRFEVIAQSSVQAHLHVNANYLVRLDPGASSWTQRFSAEVRAVF